MPGEPHLQPLRLSCAELADLLPASADGGAFDAATRAHLRSCPQCRAAAAGYRRLRPALAHLRAERLDPPPATLEAILAAVARGRRRHTRRRAYLGAVGGLAATAGAAGAFVTHRARRHRLVG